MLNKTTQRQRQKIRQGPRRDVGLVVTKTIASVVGVLWVVIGFTNWPKHGIKIYNAQMSSIYSLKPRFQSLLRPLVRRCAAAGVTANQVTMVAFVVSLALGLWLYIWPHQAGLALISVWLLLRMAFNAVDGMLAREHGQASKLGVFLNELTDVGSDAALYLPLALVHPFSPFWLGAVILLSALCEFAGVLSQTVGASRRYDGPMGKSDRAAVFGVIYLWAAFFALPEWMAFILPVIAVLLMFSIINRIKRSLGEAA